MIALKVLHRLKKVKGCKKIFLLQDGEQRVKKSNLRTIFSSIRKVFPWNKRKMIEIYKCLQIHLMYVMHEDVE